MDTMTIAGIAAGVVVLGGLGWWFFGGSSSNSGPKSKEDITKLLEAQGYRVKDVDFEDGGFEVEAYKDGKEVEIKLDKNGNILKIEHDD